MSEESQLQIRPKNPESGLNVTGVRSRLIDRGLRDLAELVAAEQQSETRRLAEQGDPDAPNELGLECAGDFDSETPEDYANAARWFRKAAEQGYAAAQFNLGVLYLVAAQKPKNQDSIATEHIRLGMRAGDLDLPDKAAESVRWFRAAAEKGNSGAQYALAEAYCNGEGVHQDSVQSYMWICLSSSSSKSSATETGRVIGDGHLLLHLESTRNLIAARMTPGQIAEAQKLFDQLGWE